MKVPLLDLKPQLESLHGEILEAVTRVVESTRYIMGPEIENLEKEIAEYCGTADAVGVSSGTDALLLSLMALDIGPGDLVLTTDFSFFATAGVISRLNATPVFLDIDPENWNLDPVQLEQKLESMSTDDRKRVKAVIVVHLYGQSAEMKPLLDCAEKYGIPVIEDAAQAIGAECRLNGSPRKVGSMGTFGCFSFFPSKNLGACGDAGIVTTNDKDLYEKIKCLRMHGETQRYHHKYIGGNFRLDTIQAGILTIKLAYLDEQHNGRQSNANYYNTHLAETIQKPIINSNSPSIYNQYTLKTAKRDALKDYLTKHTIGNNIYYPIPLHLQDCFTYLGYQQGDFPEAEKAANQVLSIPIFTELTKEELAYTCQHINQFFEG